MFFVHECMYGVRVCMPPRSRYGDHRYLPRVKVLCARECMYAGVRVCEFSHRSQALGPSVFASCSRYLCAEVYVSACVSVCLAACVHAILA